MDQRFRKAAFTAAMAATITLFSNAAWAKKPVHIEPLTKHASASKCPADLNEEISKKLTKPTKTSEFIDLISEASVTYRRASVDIDKDAELYLRETRRSPDKEKKLLKRAHKTQNSYLDSVRNVIESYATPSRPNSKEELLSLLHRCSYLDKRSVFKTVKDKLIASLLNPRPDQGPMEWVVAKPTIRPSEVTIESTNDAIVKEAMESINRRERSAPESSETFNASNSSGTSSPSNVHDFTKEWNGLSGKDKR